jgi:hypothetical protein
VERNLSERDISVSVTLRWEALLQPQGAGAGNGMPSHVPISASHRTFVSLSFLSAVNYLGYSVHITITMPQSKRFTSPLFKRNVRNSMWGMKLLILMLDSKERILTGHIWIRYSFGSNHPPWEHGLLFLYNHSCRLLYLWFCTWGLGMGRVP